MRTPIVLASMAGITNANYVLERAGHVGVAFIGGFSLDITTQEASKKMVELGRTEFFSTFEEIENELSMLKGTNIIIGLNLRGSTQEAYVAAARRFGRSVIYEIDAHCRQQPMIDAHCGEYLLHNLDTLCDIVRNLHMEGVCVSVKIRAGVIDDKLLARRLWDAGADILHIDLMDTGHACIKRIRNSCPLILIANNGINTPDRMMDMFSHGADMISLGRSANVAVLQRLDLYIHTFARENGWYNAPKQLCRGGDLRSLTFCCMPVKQCPLLSTLDRIGMSCQEYITLKQGLAQGTKISKGSHTCFGSLTWCCKSSTPCRYRDTDLMFLQIQKNEYMEMKRKVSDGIMEKIFSDVSSKC